MNDCPRHIDADLVIFGGGIAGLWLLARLRARGWRALLIETGALGQGQTRYSQGIIHGGTKYALTGKMSEAAHMVAKMPEHWRACLQGHGELDLRAVEVLAEHQYLWSTASLGSRLAGFFASRLMRSRTRALEAKDYPELFRNPAFAGQVYELNEPVLEVGSLLQALAGPHRDVMLHSRGQMRLRAGDPCVVELAEPAITVHARRLVLTAGKGNAELLQGLGRSEPQMQLRPLQMVALRGELPGIYAHCLGSSATPRVTINSAKDASGRTVWYLGGQLAEEGVGRSAEAQIAAARAELAALFPWVDFSTCQWRALPIERAEVAQGSGRLPDDVFAEQQDRVITAWPTKLALAPVLADRIEAILQQDGLAPQPDAGFAEALAPCPHPSVSPLPWQEDTPWN